SQVNAFLPEGLRTGLVPVELHWNGRLVCPAAWVRIMPAGPAVARITAITDGVNLLSGNRIVTGSAKVTLIELTRPDDFRASIDGVEAEDVDSFCADPIGQRYEFNFRLPAAIGSGSHLVRIALGQRALAHLPIEVA
ncbi:MAG TPA: hypothetical protein VG456_07025, partial [Candidatus Sulfopaludibacter sp.]|nr:hypothetical protein [Candidatus Sulfopaludibacter sp.]